jgi:hypothetical protein
VTIQTLRPSELVAQNGVFGQADGVSEFSLACTRNCRRTEHDELANAIGLRHPSLSPFENSNIVAFGCLAERTS